MQQLHTPIVLPGSVPVRPLVRQLSDKEEEMEQDEMTRQEQHDIVYRRCICEYGTQPQIDMCIEEMSELTKALLKYRRKFALVRGDNVNPTNGDTRLV